MVTFHPVNICGARTGTNGEELACMHYKNRGAEAMKGNLQEMSAEQLVERFATIGVQQDQALLGNELGKFNKLFQQMKEVREELKSRPGDQRRLLLRLYYHANAQVRLKAAVATLAVAPEAARNLIETIANSRKYPQAGDAGMALDALDRGIFKPT